MKFLVAALLLMFSYACVAQPAFTCTASGSFAGLSWTCPSTTPPIVTAPPVTQPGACTASPSDTTTPKLTRQCSGSVTYYGISPGTPYNGPLTLLSQIYSSPSYSYGTWMNFFSGATAILNVNSGQFIALAITPTGTGSIQLSNNQSWGDGGAISISTFPGQFTVGNPAVICSQNTGAGNSLIFSTVATSQCQMTAGHTYYVNFADTIFSTGDELCFQRPRNSCAGGSSKVSYVIYTSKVQ